MNFSVCICVYDKDNHKYLKEALESIYNQSVKPNQIVLVLDGPINQELETVINDYNLLISDEIDFDIIRLNKNKGHGEARKISIENAKHGLIALMDADDISRFNRFEKQIDIFQNNNELSIVGGQILEIDHASKKSISIRKVPVTDRNIKRNLTIRSPFNQMSVMFKKDDVIKAGNYKEFFHNEDYYLWARMFLEGFTFYNTPEILVDVRINESYKEGANRELYEELGIRSELTKIGKTRHSQVHHKKCIDSQHYMIYATEYDGNIKIDENELESVRLFKFEEIEKLIEIAGNYSDEFDEQEKIEVDLNDVSRKALSILATALQEEEDPEDIQNTIYQIAKANDIQPKDFFKTLYQIILGTSRGPKIGPFITDIGRKQVAKTLSEYT